MSSYIDHTEIVSGLIWVQARPEWKARLKAKLLARFLADVEEKGFTLDDPDPRVKVEFNEQSRCVILRVEGVGRS